jgi:hypothetical protein
VALNSTGIVTTLPDGSPVVGNSPDAPLVV